MVNKDFISMIEDMEHLDQSVFYSISPIVYTCKRDSELEAGVSKCL